jgi:hypothetical protein
MKVAEWRWGKRSFDKLKMKRSVERASINAVMLSEVKHLAAIRQVGEVDTGSFAALRMTETYGQRSRLE